MSLCLILQNKDSVFIGADTATSVFNGNKFIRKSNDGKKLFEIGNDIVFCSGDMSEVPDIIKNIITHNGYVDVEHISKYLKGKNFRKCPILNVPSIGVIICRVINGVSYVYDLGVENNFDVVTHIGTQKGIQIWVGGIYNEKCLEIATKEIEKSHREAINTYTNTYKSMVCEEIGGYLNTYYINSNGYRKIIDNYDLKDGYIPGSCTGSLMHGVIAQALIGNMIVGNNLDISNKEGSVHIDGDGITISNGVIKSNDYEKNEETGEEIGNIIDLRNGSFSFADGGLSYKEGNLVLKDGVIRSANYNEDEGTGSIIDLTNGEFSFAGGGLTYRSDENTEVEDKRLFLRGDIEATSIFAHESYSLSSNGEKREFLIAENNDNPAWGDRKWNLKLKLNNSTNIDFSEGRNAYIDEETGVAKFEDIIDINSCYINLNSFEINLKGNTYSKTGQIISSDRNLKHDIQDLDKEESSKFIYSLKPSKFKYNNGTSERFHHGFIAQEVKKSLGEDSAVYVEQKDGTKGLRYEEFIADLVATVQIQNERLLEQDERIRILEEKLIERK